MDRGQGQVAEGGAVAIVDRQEAEGDLLLADPADDFRRRQLLEAEFQRVVAGGAEGELDGAGRSNQSTAGHD